MSVVWKGSCSKAQTKEDDNQAVSGLFWTLWRTWRSPGLEFFNTFNFLFLVATRKFHVQPNITLQPWPGWLFIHIWCLYRVLQIIDVDEKNYLAVLSQPFTLGKVAQLLSCLQPPLCPHTFTTLKHLLPVCFHVLLWWPVAASQALKSRFPIAAAMSNKQPTSSATVQSEPEEHLQVSQY